MNREEWQARWRELRCRRSDFVRALRDRPSEVEGATPGNPKDACRLSARVRLARGQAMEVHMMQAGTWIIN